MTLIILSYFQFKPHHLAANCKKSSWLWPWIKIFHTNEQVRNIRNWFIIIFSTTLLIFRLLGIYINPPSCLGLDWPDYKSKWQNCFNDWFKYMQNCIDFQGKYSEKHWVIFDDEFLQPYIFSDNPHTFNEPERDSCVNINCSIMQKNYLFITTYQKYKERR